MDQWSSRNQSSATQPAPGAKRGKLSLRRVARFYVVHALITFLVAAVGFGAWLLFNRAPQRKHALVMQPLNPALLRHAPQLSENQAARLTLLGPRANGGAGNLYQKAFALTPPDGNPAAFSPAARKAALALLTAARHLRVSRRRLNFSPRLPWLTRDDPVMPRMLLLLSLPMRAAKTAANAANAAETLRQLRTALALGLALLSKGGSFDEQLIGSAAVYHVLQTPVIGFLALLHLQPGSDQHAASEIRACNFFIWHGAFTFEDRYMRLHVALKHAQTPEIITILRYVMHGKSARHRAWLIIRLGLLAQSQNNRSTRKTVRHVLLALAHSRHALIRAAIKKALTYPHFYHLFFHRHHGRWKANMPATANYSWHCAWRIGRRSGHVTVRYKPAGSGAQWGRPKSALVIPTGVNTAILINYASYAFRKSVAALQFNGAVFHAVLRTPGYWYSSHMWTDGPGFSGRVLPLGH